MFLKGEVEMNVPAGTGRHSGPLSYPAPTAIRSPTPPLQGNASQSTSPPAAPERCVGGTDPQGFPIWVRVTNATPGMAYNAELPRLSGKSNSPWTSAYGTYDGTNFIIQSLSDGASSHKLETPLQLAPAESPYKPVAEAAMTPGPRSYYCARATARLARSRNALRPAG